MFKYKKTLLFSLVGLLVAGCATNIITNLTPTSLPRATENQYLVEMKLDSQQQTLRIDSVQPYAMVGLNEYKMRPTHKMTNRWETYIPVAKDKDSVLYHFKVNYEYNRFGKPGTNSMLSPEYKLIIK
jgi:hypothetical protein